VPLDIVTERDTSIPVLRLIGEIDVTSVDALRQRILEQFEQETTSLAFDLTQVSFIDSMGIGALFSAKRRAAEREGDVYLLEPSGVLQRLLSLLSMEQMFIICSVADFRQKFATCEKEPPPRAPRSRRE
jgi:anti-sigma B factor antagonist